MTFSKETVEALKAKLDGAVVKTREQGGRKLSYIEGWHAIAEANRIFGFDGWTRETMLAECIYSGEYQKAVWENGRKTDKTMTMFRCTYNARVRVTVGGVFRDGTGSGHGFGENPGDAHESAIKESETDAMKRALMTFGNPFGLALYDKTQADVEKPAPKSATSRDEAMQAFFARPSYEFTEKMTKGSTSEWERLFRKAGAACMRMTEWAKLENDNAVQITHFTTTAAPPAVESFRLFTVAQVERLRQIPIAA